MRALVVMFAALVLASCIGIPGADRRGPTAIVAEAPLPAVPQGQVIGDGSVTVAMLVPMTAGGSASGLAQSFVNAAELAMNEVTTDNIRIVVRDTRGETDTARLAAEAAVTEGAQLILGPVFSPAVAGAADAARAAGVPVIAFSTDASVAGRGVYLLSFLPRQDASRIVRYAIRQGGRSAFAAMVPDNGYGIVSEAAFREAVAAVGSRVVGVERYTPEMLTTAAQALSGRGAFDALFVPNGGNDPAAVANATRNVGITAQLLGSGQWDNQAVRNDAALVGAVYPGPKEGGFADFARRYQAAFGAEPPRTASLIYDAALLANGLVGARGPGAFRPQSLEGREGFIGIDGVFRFNSNGLSERGLAVYEVQAGGGARIVAPAPTAFGQ
ncbi:MAG: penicillin-binding protein activator [Pseudomonadota bacterium]